MKEIWKDIPDYEGMYQVSNLGRVKSLNYMRTKKEKIMKGGINIKGYRQVCLCGENQKTIDIHKLVAITFLNHIPNGMKITIDHKNNIKSDNRVVNLQLITNRENSSKDKKGYSSKYTGVSWAKDKKKWCSRIYIDKKYLHLGFFISELKASKMYQLALKNIKHYNGSPKEFREYLSNFY